MARACSGFRTDSSGQEMSTAAAVVKSEWRICVSSRRRFLVQAGALAAVHALPGSARSQSDAVVSSDLALEEDPFAPRIPLTYVGLSYELAQLSDPAFFAASNDDLVAYFRLLSGNGVLRLGGNTSEFCWFRSSPSTPVPPLHVPENPGEN